MEKTDNELIAEFMGYESFEDKGRRYWRIISHKWDHLATESKDLHYESNWNDLMPVVEKIESLGYNFWIGKYASSVTKEGSGDPSFTVKGNNKIKVVYDVGLQFIRWYNSQNS